MSAGREQTYEIVVLGGLGPVLRAALEPCRTTPAEVSTIARVTGAEDQDLIEVMRRLAMMGLEITTASVVE